MKPSNTIPEKTSSHRDESELIDPRVAKAMERYLRELEEGRSPCRADYISQYPELVKELDACLQGLEFLNVAAPGLKDDSADNRSGSQLHPLATLGDFRIVREIGRGGMGVVYEAEQLSLGRRVALKILPFAAVLDERQRLRFQNESRAAASLQHAHIVPVFSIGCDRGVHYYAMQFIEGQSLTQTIHGAPAATEDARSHARLKIAPDDPNDQTDRGQGPRPGQDLRPDPPETVALTDGQLSTVLHGDANNRFHAVARLGAHVADALEYGHAMGVIHRDIKPANLLLDEAGKVWVTDYGLASTQSDTSLTLSGDLVGTLRYMSPEQARGGHSVLDHRTDIYSLGVTLYELLAFRPPFDGGNREELLHLVANREPRRLRQVNHSIPKDLETIVLKSMAKDPDDRYVTARALADDLLAFLDDRPIQARRPTVLERAGRWSRRHVAVVWTAASVMMLITAITSASVLLVGHSLEKERTARSQEDTNLQIANENARRAHDSLHFAREAVDELYTDFSATVEYQPGLTVKQSEFLEKATRFYDRLNVRAGDDLDAQRSNALTMRRLAEIHLRLGDIEESVQAAEQAVAILEPIVAQGDSFEDCLELARAMMQTISINVSHERDERVVGRLLALIDELRRVLPKNPETQRAVIDLTNLLARKVHLMQQYERANTLTEWSVQTAERLTLDEPDNQANTVHLVRSLITAAYVRLRVSLLPGVVQSNHGTSDLYLRAITLARDLAGDPPYSLKDRRRLANWYHFAPPLLPADRAHPILTECIRLNEALRTESPEIDQYRTTLVAAYDHLSKITQRLKRPNDAIGAMRRKIALLMESPQPTAIDKFEVGFAYDRVAYLLLQMGDISGARDAYREEISWMRRSLAHGPNQQSAHTMESLRMTLMRLAGIEAQLGDAEASARAMEEFTELLPAMIDELTRRIVAGNANEGLYTNRGVAFTEQGDFRRALADFEQALEIQPAYAKARNAKALALWELHNEDPNRTAEALTAFDDVVNSGSVMQSLRAEIHLKRALLLHRLGRACIDDLEKCLSADPSPYYRQTALQCLSSKLADGADGPRDLDLARSYAQEAIEIEQNAGSLMAVARVEYHGRHYQEAIQAIEKAKSRDDWGGGLSDDVFASLLLSLCHYGLDHHDEARRYFQQASKQQQHESRLWHHIKQLGHEAANLLKIDVAETVWDQPDFADTYK